MPTAAELGRQVDEFAGMMSQYKWRREPWEGGGHDRAGDPHPGCAGRGGAGLTMFWVKYRWVTVTQDAIDVLESSKLSGGAQPQLLPGTLSRCTQLGPVSGRWGQLNLLGERHWVHKRFYPQIAEADREADRYSRTAGI